MTLRLWIKLLAVAWAVQTIHAAGADGTTQGRIDALRKTIAAAQEAKTPDITFQYNPGLTLPMKAAEKLGGTDSRLAKTLTGEGRISQTLGGQVGDISAEGLLNARIENVEQRFKQQTSAAELRQTVVDKLDRKHQAYQKLGEELGKNPERTVQALEAAGEESLKAKEALQARLRKGIRSNGQALDQARTQSRAIQARKAEVALAKETAQLAEFQRDIARSRAQLEQLKVAKLRKSNFDGGGFLVGLALTAIRSELEENAQAEKEGRRPQLLNKLVSFAKNVSGYSTVMSVMENVEAAKLESIVASAEFYERHGIDINDPLIRAHAEASMRRAVVRTALYEGGKLAPVVGDMMTVKETADAALGAYAAIEESNLIQSSNRDAQFQTSLRAGVHVEAKVREMEAVAAQAKLLLGSLGRLREQLLALEMNAEANRDQIRNALSVLDTYRQQSATVKNPAFASQLDPARVSTLLQRIEAIRKSAEEQSGNLHRVRSERLAGKISPQAVATQVQFIRDLLQPVVTDHAAIGPILSGIDAISHGADIAKQVPQAIEFLKQARPVMQQQAEIVGRTHEVYRQQATSLEQLAARFRELREDMKKSLSYLRNSKNLEEAHQEKIRAALDRANSVDIDITAVRRTVDAARTLRLPASLSNTLADLDSPLQGIDSAQLDTLVQQAQQAGAKLVSPYQMATGSLKNALALLEEVTKLAGDARPVVVDAVPNSKESPKKEATPAKSADKPKAAPAETRPQKGGAVWSKTIQGSFSAGTVSFPADWGAFSSRVADQMRKSHTIDLPGKGWVILWTEESGAPMRETKKIFDPGMLSYNRTEIGVTRCSSQRPPCRGTAEEVLKAGRLTLTFVPGLEPGGSSGNMIHYKTGASSYEVIVKWSASKPDYDEAKRK